MFITLALLGHVVRLCQVQNPCQLANWPVKFEVVHLLPPFSVCSASMDPQVQLYHLSGDAGTAPDVTTFAAGSCRAPWAVAAEQLQMLRQQGLKQDVTRPDGGIAR